MLAECGARGTTLLVTGCDQGSQTTKSSLLICSFGIVTQGGGGNFEEANVVTTEFKLVTINNKPTCFVEEFNMRIPVC